VVEEQELEAENASLLDVKEFKQKHATKIFVRKLEVGFSIHLCYYCLLCMVIFNIYQYQLKTEPRGKA